MARLSALEIILVKALIWLFRTHSFWDFSNWSIMEKKYHESLNAK